MDAVEEDHGAVVDLCSELGDLLLSGHSVEHVLDLALQAGFDEIDSMTDGSVTLRRRDDVYTSNATSEKAKAVDQQQYGAEGSPCLTAISTGDQVRVSIESISERWPGFAQAARAAGYLMVMATPLSVADRAIGALNLYSDRPGGFDASEQAGINLLAKQVAVVLGAGLALEEARAKEENLTSAIESRELIGIATGALMTEQHCDRDEAFDILRRASQRQNRKVREVASDLVGRVEARANERSGAPAPLP
jgi:GAF domain-containing protein